jgi:serine/threonine protein kinase
MADSSPLALSPTQRATEPRVRGDGDARLESGTSVGEYIVDRFIGAGAMGEVYSGKHPVIGKRVAIKVLRVELASSAEAAERFIREARAVNQIEHENVVDVFAFGRLDDGRLYLVMDLVEGRSLRAHLVDGPLPVQDALAILETIADALDAAHARGVVHRDLKPDNIVLSNATPPKVFVLDFGIAKLISQATEGGPVTPKSGPGTLTGAGTWLGTPGYMAPEQWSVDGAGTASDRYALGVIAFELLTGAQPYSATSVPGMMEQHFRAEVPTLSSRGGMDLPSALDSVMRKALAKDPDQRYRTARDLVTALRDAAGTGAMRARGAVTPPTASKKLLMPAVAGVSVLAVGIVAVVVLGKDKAPEANTPTPSARNMPPAGKVTVNITTEPENAEVRSGGHVSLTPTKLFLDPGDTVTLTIRKGGYMPEKKTVTVGDKETTLDRVRLIAIDGFQGVWQLPNGELRVFERSGEQVNVSKADTVTGPRRFFTRYAFALDDRNGAAFGGQDVIADPHAPTEATCNVSLAVEYFYDNDKKTLEQSREHVELEFLDGKCIERSRRKELSYLLRADRRGETHEIAMPVGRPDKGSFEKTQKNIQSPPDTDLFEKKKPSPKQVGKKKPLPPKTLPLDPKADLLGKQSRQADGVDAANTKQAKTVKPPTYTSPKNAVSGSDQNLSPPNSQVVPQANAPAPTMNAEPQQQAVPPQQAAPPPQVKKAPSKSAAEPIQKK